jgi:hypothetical protein
MNSNSSGSGSGRAATLPVGYAPFPGMMVPAHPPFSPMMVPAHVSFPGAMMGPAHPGFPGMHMPAHAPFPGMRGPTHAPFPGMRGPAHAPFPPMQMVPVYGPFPGHPRYLNFVTPVCKKLPNIEKKGLAAINVHVIDTFWHHFCPNHKPFKRNKTKKDSVGGLSHYKEFTCCGTAALCCQVHCGELIFSMRGQHAGFFVLPPVPFKIKLKAGQEDVQAEGDLRSIPPADDHDPDDEGDEQGDEAMPNWPTGETEAAPAMSDQGGSVGIYPSMTTDSESLVVDVAVIPFVPERGTEEDEAEAGSLSSHTAVDVAPHEPTFEEARILLVQAFESKKARYHLERLARDKQNSTFVVRIGGMGFKVFLGACVVEERGTCDRCALPMRSSPLAYSCLVVAPAPP